MGLLLGIAVVVGVYVAESGALVALPLLLLPALWMMVWFRGTVWWLGGFATVGLVLGALIGLISSSPSPPPLQEIPSQIRVDITSDPQIDGRGVRVEGRWEDSEGIDRTSYLYLPASARVGRGDQILASGWSPDDSNGVIIFVDQVRLERQAGWLDRRRTSLRSSFDHRLQAVVPGSPGSLALGLITGDDSGLPEDEEEALRLAGLSHITAVSGWNVTVVAGSLTLVLSALKVRRNRAFFIAVPSIAFYAWLVGPDPPIVRAAIIGCVGLFGMTRGRPLHLFTPLSLTGAAMVLMSPEILDSLSFQLSFVSMLGVSIVGHLVSSIDSRLRMVLAAATLSPVGAALMTAPIIANTFGYVSLYTVPANIVVAPLIPVMTYLGIATIGLETVPILKGVPLLGDLVGALVWLLGAFILEVSRFVASLPGARLMWGPANHNLTVTFYAVLITLIGMLTPEGRFLWRRSTEWYRRRPAQVVTAAFTASAVVLCGGVITTWLS